MTQESVPMGRRADTAGDRQAARPQAGPARPSSPAPLPVGHPTSAMISWAIVGLGYSMIAGSFARLTIPAAIATLLPGGALVWYATRPTTARRPAPPAGLVTRRSTLAWTGVAVAFGIWELYAALRGSTHAHPTLSILMRGLIDPPPARAAGYAAWLLAGVWVVRR